MPPRGRAAAGGPQPAAPQTLLSQKPAPAPQASLLRRLLGRRHLGRRRLGRHVTTLLQAAAAGDVTGHGGDPHWCVAPKPVLPQLQKLLFGRRVAVLWVSSLS
jgi:hypothetical protein